MKRLFLVVVAVLSMATTFAENENANAANKANAYNMSVNYTKLAECLALSMDQLEAVKDIHSDFSARMMNAANANGQEREKMVKKAINKDLAYMRTVLNHDQYRKYLAVLNATMVNRGLLF